MGFCVPEKYRVKVGRMRSDERFGNNGAFLVPLKRGQKVRVIASDQMGWEHVSVSRIDRCPTWEEMTQVKELFWTRDCAVMQLHPPASDYVSDHPFCLHLWRPTDAAIPLPDPILVGYGRKYAGALADGEGAA